MEETNGNIRVLSPFEAVQYWNSIPERSETYADTNAVSVFPREGPNEKLRQRALEVAGINPKDLTTPLLILNLGVEPSDNEFGFTFTETPYVQAIKAPFLSKDQRVKYDPKRKTLVSSEDGRVRLVQDPKGRAENLAIQQQNLDLYSKSQIISALKNASLSGIEEIILRELNELK